MSNNAVTSIGYVGWRRGVVETGGFCSRARGKRWDERILDKHVARIIRMVCMPMRADCSAIGTHFAPPSCIKVAEEMFGCEELDRSTGPNGRIQRCDPRKKALFVLWLLSWHCPRVPRVTTPRSQGCKQTQVQP